MAHDRSISAQFCDDIRRELGNKFSLIGCYGSSMYLQPIPSVLPKLCAQVQIFTSIEKPFSKLIVRIFKDDDVVAESVFPDEALQIRTDSVPEWASRQVLNSLVVMSPFSVEAPCRLRIEAETEDGIINGGSFLIAEASAATNDKSTV